MRFWKKKKPKQPARRINAASSENEKTNNQARTNSTKPISLLIAWNVLHNNEYATTLKRELNLRITQERRALDIRRLRREMKDNAPLVGLNLK